MSEVEPSRRSPQIIVFMSEANVLQHEIINPRDVAIATATFYPKYGQDHLETVRGNLALRNLQLALQRGFNVVTIDGGSSDLFKTLAESGGVNLFPEMQKGMSPSRRQAYREAFRLVAKETGVVIWQEPEKNLIGDEEKTPDCIQAIIRPLLLGEADLVVPKRNEALFRLTYPEYQYRSETEGNKRFNRFLRDTGVLKEGPDLDVFFGPKAFRATPELLTLFLQMYDFDKSRISGVQKFANPENYFDATMLPVVDALIQGRRVLSVEVPFMYPSEQKHIEESYDQATLDIMVKKRRAQFFGIIDELIHYLTYRDYMKGTSKITPKSISDESHS